VDIDRPAVAELMSEVAAAVTRRVAVVREDVYETIVREIPQLRDDKPVLALLASSVDSNVDTCLQIMQHRIDLSAVPAPAAAVEYARRLAQRGTPLTALLRAYRVGHACFTDWVLKELAQHPADAEMVSAATLSMSRVVAGYIDHISEKMVEAYGQEREIWLRNRSAARAARIRDLLSGERIDVSAAEVTLGYRLRQYHVGVVCWAGDAAGTTEEITRLERAISHVAGQAACHGDALFLPRDESSAWAWLPLGILDGFDAAAADKAEVDDDIHFAFGDAAKGTRGFRVTHQQAIAAQAVALASGSPAPRAVTFSQVAPVAMMLASRELLRPWVLGTLAGLATDDEHHARLRETLLVFLQSGGSYKTTAERLMLHKNTVQYRVRKAQESIGRPVGENRSDVEFALRASHWLGSSVLGPAAGTGLARVRAGGDRAGGVGDPFGPGADVEGGGDAREGEGEDLVGGGDAGAAVRADGGPVGGAERGEAASQVGWRAERPVGGHVLRGRGADRAGDVAGHRVDRLGLAAVPGSRPRVEQHARAGQRRGAVRVEEGQVPGRRGEITSGRGGCLQARLHRVTSRLPGGEAAVEHPHLPVAEVPQQPPRAGGRRGVGVVVDHDRPIAAHAGSAHGGLERGRGGHRVPAAGAWRGREVAV